MGIIRPGEMARVCGARLRRATNRFGGKRIRSNLKPGRRKSSVDALIPRAVELPGEGA